MQTMKEAVTFLSNSFRCRMKSTYMINCSGTIKFAWGTVKGFMDEETSKKISLYGDGVPTLLFQHANKSQVEQKFGGSIPNITDYWYSLSNAGHPRFDH